MKLKALIYARVSTTMQEDGNSLLYQIKKCEDYCKLKGYEIYKVIEDVESGANDDRVGFLKLQEEIGNRKFDLLLVYESSRLSRKTLTMLNFVMELEKNNIKFTSISQPELDTTTPTGMLFFQIQAGLSEYERKQISGRVKSSKHQRAKDGKWQGGNLPLGYKKEGGKIVIDEKTSHEVKSIFHYYLSTHSLSQTAKMYNKPPSSIEWILRNEFYLGKLAFGKKEKNINTGITKINDTYHLFDGEHPQLIDTDLFEAVQRIIQTRKRVIRVEGKLLFTGILHCSCGSKMYKATRKEKDKIRVLYQCEECKKVIAYKKAEDAILELLFNLEEMRELDNETEDEDFDLLKEKIKFHEDTISRNAFERKRFIQLFSKDIITSLELEDELSKLKSQSEAAEKEIKNLKNILEMNVKSENYESNLEMLKNIIENMDEEQDRNEIHKLFKLLISRINFISRKPLKFKIVIQ